MKRGVLPALGGTPQPTIIHTGAKVAGVPVVEYRIED